MNLESLSPVNILCVGHVCVDIINLCIFYPEEDAKVGTKMTDNRCIEQRRQRGGNAANNCSVLSLLGANTSFLGTIADSDKRFLLDSFAQYNVNTEYVVVHKSCQSPTACVILSATTGSRTIIHSNKDLPELSLEDFLKVKLQSFSWVHFEGRNVANVCMMIEHVRKFNADHPNYSPITISVEIERAKSELECLVPLADVLFVSKDFSKFKGLMSMIEIITYMQGFVRPNAKIICPWGEEGACAHEVEANTTWICPSFPPKAVIDTLGAGDTFNAASIFALASGHSLKESITFGCYVAGAKVGVKGWEPLIELQKKGAFSLLSQSEQNSSKAFRLDIPINKITDTGTVPESS